MAKAGGPSEIGSISVGIRGDNSQLKQSLAEARTEAEITAATLDGSMREAAKSINEATGGVRKLTGAITSTLQVATRALGIIGLITGALAALVTGLDQVVNGARRTRQEVARTMDEVRATLDSISNPKVGPAAIFEKELAAINAAYGAGADAAKKLSGASQQALRDELRRIRDAAIEAVTARRDEAIAAEEVRAATEAAALLEQQIAKDSEAVTRQYEIRARTLEQAADALQELERGEMSAVDRRIAELSDLLNLADAARSAGNAGLADSIADAVGRAVTKAIADAAEEHRRRHEELQRKLNRELVDDIREVMRESLGQIQVDVRAIQGKASAISNAIGRGNQTFTRIIGR
jgi:hypothetical protein